MYRIKTMNKISPKGLAHLDADRFEVGDAVAQEQAILVRSAKLHDYDFPTELLAIARAGAGVNNIPLDRCSESGIVVFNTPGANANAVKELAICALLLASRNISGGIEWVKDQVKSGVDVAQVVEKGKAAFAGQEIMGKTLGVVGLGAIGILVANAAVTLGMDVVGYDPFLSVSSALSLSPKIRYVQDLSKLYGQSDYISLHLPMTSETRASINKDAFAQMKDGVRIINLARGELVHNADMIAALESGKVASYVTDFPDSEISGVPNVVPIPHLGASTEESEENCAIIAALELQDYLENGNIKNSVNLPNLSQDWQTAFRISILHRQDQLTGITSLLSQRGITAEFLSSKAKGDYTYTLLDTNVAIDDAVISALSSMDGVLRIRVLTH
ncbi:MAG: D-3-phosphoglycerate dehydrogenase [Evtepia sp.]|jgi:D-3-phosphoglycerate dehydrogenase|nr:D-3-phosphoglycerate dehydrogenase [Evtepia sp.]